jgi:hypothetical protein
VRAAENALKPADHVTGSVTLIIDPQRFASLSTSEVDLQSVSGQSPPRREKRTVRNFGAGCSTVCNMFYCYIYKKLFRLQIELFYQL